MELEDETIKMRMFTQSLGGEPKKWFKILAPNSIHDLPALYQTFINRWEIRKNPIQILSEYKNLKRNMGEVFRTIALDSTVSITPSRLT